MEVSGEREELTAQVRGDLLHKNVVSKGTAMARAGNIKGAQAIMKGYHRHAKTKLAAAPMMQQNVMA